MPVPQENHPVTSVQLGCFHLLGPRLVLIVMPDPHPLQDPLPVVRVLQDSFLAVLDPPANLAQLEPLEMKPE